MDDYTYPRDPLPGEYRALVYLRLIEQLLSVVLVAILLWQTLSGVA